MTILTYHDARQLYEGSVVQIGDNIGFVTNVNEANPPTLTVRFIGAREYVEVEADPAIINCPLEPHRLGYAQYGNRARYLKRLPRRQYAVGWTEGNVEHFNFSSLKTMGRVWKENLMGNYPSFKRCIQLSKENGGTFAFDRMFAVSHEGQHLEYKGSAITYIKEDGTVDLEDRKMGWLRPLFETAANKE